MHVPPLETERLLIRRFTMDDVDAIHQILDIELADSPLSPEEITRAREERAVWLQWSVLNYDQLESLAQPPLGDRAVVLRESGELIGACGYAPLLDALGQLPAFDPGDGGPTAGLTSIEIGLYYALSPRYHRRGYASEAAQALVDHAFHTLRLRRIVANTTYDNEASMGVMRRLGMQLERNPLATPPWLQVVGVLYHPEVRGAGGREPVS